MLTNVTFSINPVLLQQARKKAAIEHKTLNQIVRGWIEGYVRGPRTAEDFSAVMRRLGHVNSGGHWSRDERNER